ncbi:hypothetical protein AAFP30_21555 [Gordonia sp. CPCC 205515]|uniref:hypothetical protein n=1 Tax=Gordonia sp. CPCC 205515 TaxID=3140791 RepID=UPI003AF34C9D
MGSRRRTRGVGWWAVLGTLALTIGIVSAPTAWPRPGDRVETVYAAQNGVTASVVRLRIPLPASAGPHPASCDWLSYLRFRPSDGPASSGSADRVLIAQPGIFEGAGAFDSVARNTVTAAAGRGHRIEFWALDRRSNCLEDHTGIAAGLRTGSLDAASNYYFGGTSVAGRRFAGFPTSGPAVDWLRHQGIAQTVRDEYDLLRHEIPDPRVRARKVLCGGHSMGGFVTGYFAGWDFDGNPRTTGDAGYRQCAGYFALDTAVTSDFSFRGASLPDLPPPVGAVLEAATGKVDETLPVLALPAVINPETMNLLSIVGLAAHLRPNGVDEIVRRLPDNPNVNATLRVLLSKDLGQFVTGIPDVRSLHATNTAILGAILDDNSQPFGFLQASVGFITGGPVAPKDFPVPNAVALSPLGAGSFGNAPKFSPTGFDPRVLYSWRDYDQIDRSLWRYTTPRSEITSIHQLAHDLSVPPLDFTEWYFPTALPTSLAMASAPSTAAHLRYPGVANRAPMITFVAEGGVQVTPPDNPRQRVVRLPGYNHIDVLTAAARQNNGRPEQVSTQLADFAISGR